MKRVSCKIVVLGMVVALGGLAVNLGHAQVVTRPNQTNVRLVAADVHLVHSFDSVYKYDSKSGATWRLSVLPDGKSGWQLVEEDGEVPKGSEPRYEVCEGNNTFGFVIRLDRVTNRTWSSFAVNGKPHWSEIK
ncbi:MAG: hypothetical protein JNK63_03930 [Chthonomonas sp.]|nr:hypothetical protein [Chthonomonas sp.]